MSKMAMEAAIIAWLSGSSRLAPRSLLPLLCQKESVHSPWAFWLLPPHVFQIGSAVVGAPRLEAPFAVQLVGEVDIRLAVQQIAQVQAGALQMHGVDLKVSPVEGAVRIVVVGLTFPLWIFGALDGERHPAIRSKLPARVLLPGGKPPAVLIGLSVGRIL